MIRAGLCMWFLVMTAGSAWGQPREWFDDFTAVTTYDSNSLMAPCSGGSSTKYTLLEALSGDIYASRALSGGGVLSLTGMKRTGIMGRMEAMVIGVIDLGQDCPDNPDPGGEVSQITSEPFTSDDVCIYAGFRYDPWQVRHRVDTYNIRGTDGKPGVANVDDDLDGVTDDDDESPAARPTSVNGGYGNRNGTGFRAGVDAAPGVAGVDDDGNGVVDDSGETGWSGSDDGDDGSRQTHWFMMNVNLDTSSSIHVEAEPPSSQQFCLRQIVGAKDYIVENCNEIITGFFQANTHYNMMFCASGSCYGAMLWTGVDMGNPDETLGPHTNTQHTGTGDNLVGFSFYQNSSPLQFIRSLRVLGNSNFNDTYWVVSGNTAQFYPSPSADLDKDRDVDGFDFLTFSNCYNGSNKPPLAACSNQQADLDDDGDVDGFDFLTFSNCYNGSNRKPLAACFPPNLTTCGT